MLILFCLRLAFGLLAALLLLRSAQINPRFYRTHLLTVLGLGAAALVLMSLGSAPVAAWIVIVAMVLAFVGSLSWSLEGAPGGHPLILLTLLALGFALWPGTADTMQPLAPALEEHALFWRVADTLTSALLLGVAMTAMLMGHSYLVAPSMSLTPLKTLLVGTYVCLGLRAILAGVNLGFWMVAAGRVSLTDVTLLWLPLRWGIGLVLPAILGVLAWHTTRIRNTQSSTGILYIVVVFAFIGELTAQLLLGQTGYIL